MRKRFRDSLRYLRTWGVIGVLLFLAALLAFVVIIYKMLTPGVENQCRDYKEFQVTGIAAGRAHTLTLAIAYPIMIPWNEISRPGRRLDIWLVDTDSQPVSLPLSYTVSLEQDPHIVFFTTASGEFVGQQAQLVARSGFGEPVTRFLSRVPLPEMQPSPDQAKIVLKIEGPPPSRLQIVPTNTVPEAGWITGAIRAIFCPKGSPGITKSEPTIQVELETRWRNRIRSFFELLQDMPEALLSLAALLLTLVLYRQEQQRQRDQSHRELMTEINSLESEWQEDRSKAIDNYIELWKDADKNQDREADDALKRLWDESWHVRVLDEAITSFTGGNTRRAQQLYDSVLRESSNAEPIHVLLDASSSSEQRIRAIVALAAGYGSALKESLSPLLVGALEDEPAVSALVDAQYAQPLARWLFTVPEVRAKLEGLQASGIATDKISPLLTLGAKSYSWPRLWPEPPEAVTLQKLKNLGWERNPFPPGAEQAERDPELPALFDTVKGTVKLPAWEPLRAAEPTLLCSVPGCGQTALLWGLVSCLQTGKEVPGHFFPIWVEARALLAASGRWGQLQGLAFAEACALLDFLAFNPFAWDETTPLCRRAIAHLIGTYRGLLGDLVARLQAAGLKDPQAAARLAQAIVADSTSLTIPTDEGALLRTMAEARPAGFWGHLFAVDLSSRQPECAESEAVARRLQPLVALMPDLAVHNLIIKLGVPHEVGRHLNVGKIELTCWEKDWLATLLRERVGRAGGNLGQLFGHPKPTDPEQQIAAAAHGSPRRLMQLGGALMELYAKREGPLTAADLQQLLVG